MKSTELQQKMAPQQIPKVFFSSSKPNSDPRVLKKPSVLNGLRAPASQQSLHSQSRISMFSRGSFAVSGGRRWRSSFVFLAVLFVVLSITDLSYASVSEPAVIAADGSSSSASELSSTIEDEPLSEELMEISTDRVPNSPDVSGGGKKSKKFLTPRDIILGGGKKGEVPSSSSPSSTAKFISKASLDLLTKRLIASKDKNSQQFLNKLMMKKAQNLKGSSSNNLKATGDSNSEGGAKSMSGGKELFVGVGDHVYEDPDDGQLEIKTESPPSPDLEPIYKGCPVFANGELAGLRPHGATWSEGDDQCEVCECRDGEQRCYYHYCNGPKLGFITPPSAETPTASEGGASITEKIPSATADDAIGGQMQGNTEQGVLNLDRNHSQSGRNQQNEETLLERLGETTAGVENQDLEKFDWSDGEEESSGRPPWSYSDDEDVYYDYDDHDNHINNIGLPPKADSTLPRKVNHLGDNSAVHHNHVVFLDDYDPFEAFDPLDTFEAVVDSSHADLGRDPNNPAAETTHPVDHKTGLNRPDCDTDCSKSCPYGYKITPSSGCPSCKCRKCLPLHHCRLHCPSGYTTDTFGCPVCLCRSAATHPPPVTVHHTLGAIKDTHRLQTNNNTHNMVNTSAGVDHLPVHHNDVTYDTRTDAPPPHHNIHHNDVSNHHGDHNNDHHKNVDPHNHFYDNAFNILKADELSILRDNDDDRHEYTTVSSLDDTVVYDVDFGLEGRQQHDSKEDDLSTTVGWEEVERRHDDGTTHDEKDCDHTAPPVCQDPSGDRHRIGASWRRDPCTVCRCYARGYAECTVTQCHQQQQGGRDCGPPPPGECCPRCHGAHLSRAAIPAPSPPLQHNGGRSSLPDDVRTEGGDAVKEPVRSDLTSICLVVIGLVGSGSLVACLAIHYWRRYHSAKYEIAGNITAEEAQKLRPVKVNYSDDVTSATPLKPAKCV